MNKKSIIVLYGKSNVGKTSTLQQMIIRLCGGNKLVPAVQSAFVSEFSSVDSHGKYYYKDANVIHSYKGQNIFISTGGDTWAKVRGNFEFMNKISGPKNVYVFHNGSFEIFDNLTPQEQGLFRECNVFVTAASLSPSGAFDAAKHFTTDRAGQFHCEAWVSKEKSKQSPYIDNYKRICKSDDVYAGKIIKVIDRIIAGEII